MRRLAVTILLCSLGASVLVGSATSENRDRHKRELSAFGEYAVRFQPGTSLQNMTKVVKKAGGSVIEDMHQIYALEVASTDPKLLANLQASPLVLAAFVDGVGPSAHSQLGGPSGTTTEKAAADGFDPWHGQYQWDDKRMDVPAPSAQTSGAGVKVAVLDSGIQSNHTEIAKNYAGQKNFIPCDALGAVIGSAQVKKFLGIRDCNNQDNDGHGTWIATRIAGALNGNASNGVAPSASVLDEKMLAADYGFDSAWAVAAMLDACDRGARVLNMALVEYNDPTDAADAQDYLLWADAASYCQSKGAVIVAAAGNDHVRVDRVSMTVAGRNLSGVGVVSSTNDGIGLPAGAALEGDDLRGLLEVPAGLPGVIMVSATGNTVADGAGSVPDAFRFPAGLTDQLAYYSNYGSRVDLAAPGGARAFNVPDYDAGGGNVFTDGFGIFAGTDGSSFLCDPSIGTGCFKSKGDAYMWLQGTSQATANVSGSVAALLSAKPGLSGNPGAVLGRLQATARRTMTNVTGPMSDSTADTLDGPCPTGFCHIATDDPISFSDAYGAGIVDLGAAAH